MADLPALVMLVGAPRSGTTWLQTLLGAHEQIATPQETDLFRVYLAPMLDAWDQQMHSITVAGDTVSGDSAKRRKGLPLVLTEAQFDDAIDELRRTMLAAVQAMKPSASIVVEKSPSHSIVVDRIVRLAPETKFLHIIRDGRDTASSMIAAAEGWGAKWAPSSIARAADRWDAHVRSARTASTLAAGYLEVRYEDLRGANGVETLRRAYAFTGVDISDADATELLSQFSFERQRSVGAVAQSILLGGEAGTHEKVRTEPEGFFRKGKVGGWRDEWSVADKRAFLGAAGPLLVELGYEPDNSWVGPKPRQPLANRIKHRAANESARRLRGLADWFERLPTRGK